MAVPVGHFSVGLLPGLVVWAACLLKSGTRPVRRWVLYLPVVMLLCGVWSMMPDFPKLLGGLGLMEGGSDTKLEWARDPAWNVCFFHYSIDMLATEPDGSLGKWLWDTSPFWGIGIFVVSFAAVVLGYLLELAKRGGLPGVEGRT